MADSFVTMDDLKTAILDLAARRRYRIMFSLQGWGDGSKQAHDAAREAVRPDDVATVAAILWSHDQPLAPSVPSGGDAR